MKIRNGFVSNSSTSSFCIYGKCFEGDDEVKEFYKKLFNKDAKINEDDGMYEILEEIEKETSLSYYRPYDEGIYIGKSWTEIDDNETGKEFKKSIEKVLGKDCDTYEEAYQD